MNRFAPNLAHDMGREVADLIYRDKVFGDRLRGIDFVGGRDQILSCLINKTSRR